MSKVLEHEHGPSGWYGNLPVTLTKADLARVMHRSVRWVERQLKAGTLPIPRIKQSPHVLFAREDVNRWREEITFARTGE